MPATLTAHHSLYARLAPQVMCCFKFSERFNSSAMTVTLLLYMQTQARQACAVQNLSKVQCSTLKVHACLVRTGYVFFETLVYPWQTACQHDYSICATNQAVT